MAVLDSSGLNYFFTKLKTVFASKSHTHNAVTTSTNGYMSTGDKSKLDGIATGATKNSITQSTVTLTASKWSSKTQTVTVSGVTASNMVVVSVDSNVNGIECTAQGTNTLTFTAETTPTANVTVKVAIIS